MNIPARIGTTRSSTPNESRSLRRRHDHATAGAGRAGAGGGAGAGAGDPWGGPQPSPPGLSPIDPVLSSMSPSGAPEVSGSLPSDRCRRDEGGPDHVALNGLVRRVAGGEGQRGIGGRGDDVDGSRGHDLMGGRPVGGSAVCHLADDVFAGN